MRDEDKPFVMVRRGRFSFSITPRGANGWMQFGIWMALMGATVLAFVRYAGAHEGTANFPVGLALFIAAMVGWNLAMIWWMKGRAEVIDVEELLKLKREADRKQRGGR